MSDVFFRIFHTNDSLIIHNIMKSDLAVIDREFVSITIKDKSYLDYITIIKADNTSGIIGIIKIAIYDILIYITSSKKVGNIGDKEIYEILDIDFIQLSKNSGYENYKTRGEIVVILEEIKNIFKQGFYYSHGFDLSNSLQNQKNIKVSNNNHYDFIKNCNKNFLWNYELYSKFFDHNLDSEFMINIICGYVEICREVIDDNFIFDYILISRRSTKNAGVRSIKKSVDHSGNVANYIETEQIFICGKNVFSFVQIRGNPPLFYDKFRALLHAGKNMMTSENIKLYELFDKHFQKILRNSSYKYIFVINLMNQLKTEEKNLTELYEKLIIERNYKNLRYTYFDYEKEVKSLNNFIPLTSEPCKKEDVLSLSDDPIDKLLKKIDDILISFKFFGIYYSNTENTFNNNYFSIKENVVEQQGLIRTSCYDSLERTNIIQMRIAWRVLLKQMDLINLKSDKIFGKDFNYIFDDYGENFDNLNSENRNYPLNNTELQQLISFTNNCRIDKNEEIAYTETSQTNNYENYKYFDFSNLIEDGINLEHQKKIGKNKIYESFVPHKFLKTYKKIWYNNCERISLQYSGSQIPNHDFENSNKTYSGISHVDNLKQRCMDILLKKYNVSFNNIDNERIKKELENHLDKYSRTENLILFIGSWNVAAQSLSDTSNLINWFYPKNVFNNHKTPDIYVIGLQEIVELNANYLLISSNNHKVDFWKKSIRETLDNIDNYSMIKCMDLVGVFFIIFVKSSIKDKIKNLDHVIIKTGLMGTLGNKGSCLLRFNYLDTTFAFSCGHLAAGSSANSNRISEMQEILSKNFPIQKDLKFREHDVAIIFGDLNFRIDVDYETCLEMIKNNSLSYLSECDQFNKIKIFNHNFSDLLEGNLQFSPTYKYVKGTNEYDSKRKRVPSWCDRIFYKKSRFINQIVYNRVELLNSDHRPIFSVFNLCAHQEIKEEKLKIIKEIKKSLLLDLKPNIGNAIGGKMVPDEYKEIEDPSNLKINKNKTWDEDVSKVNYLNNKFENDIFNYFK